MAAFDYFLPLPESVVDGQAGHLGHTNMVHRTVNGLVDRARMVVTPFDYGAVGDGATDDRAAIQAALDANSRVFFPPARRFRVNGTLLLNDFNTLVGFGPHGGEDNADGSSQIVFNHASAPCFAAKDTTTPLLHAGFMGLTIRATGAATWVWDFPSLAGFKMAFVRAVTTSNLTGGFRSVKNSQSSWATNWQDVEIRITDASTAYAVDTDLSDSAFVGGHFTGGKGTILRGTGGIKLSAIRMDRTSGYGVTISNETESMSQHSIIGCQIEENALGGVLVDGDANNAIVQPWCMPIITGNHFRNPDAAHDILFRNNTGAALRGGLVGGNSHNIPTATPVVVSGNWSQITQFPSAHNVVA